MVIVHQEYKLKIIIFYIKIINVTYWASHIMIAYIIIKPQIKNKSIFQYQQ